MNDRKPDSQFSDAEGNLKGAQKDTQSITAEWIHLQDFIDNVQLREVKNVIKGGGGVLTEVFRADWSIDDKPVDQVFQNLLQPGEISGWHAHQFTQDRIFVNWGNLKIVLYDARTDSSTHGKINEFALGQFRPGLLLIPPGVWHAVKNIDEKAGSLLNLVDRAYSYESPDHWRLSVINDQIPYRFD